MLNERELIMELGRNSAEYIIYGNEEIIQWAKRTLDVANNDVNEKVLRCLK